MRRRVWLTLIAAILMAAFLVGCASDSGSNEGSSSSPSGGSDSSSEDKTKVALILPGLIDDQSWNQAGYEGLKQLEADGFEIAYTERVTQDQHVEIFRNYARQGYDIIIGHGGEFMDAALLVGEEFPELQFVVTNGDRSAPNVTSIAVSFADMGYLAGITAAHMTESNQVAVVIGSEIPVALEAVRGFRAGVASVSEDIEVKVTVSGTYDDVAIAREATLALISGGADVVWQIHDSADAGVMSAAEDEGIMAIGLWEDQSHLAPTAHIGAAMASPAEIIIMSATQELDGEVHVEGVATGVVTFGAFSDRVPQEVRDAVKAAEDGLRSGDITY